MNRRVPLARYPGMNRFVLDWLGGDERFLRRGTHRETAPDVRRQPHDRGSLAAALEESNRRWGISTDASLGPWARGESLTIIAGQQVGFAGGPLYTLAKLATLVRLKRDLESQGIPVTAFFWLATEDHDFDEVASLNLPVSTLSSTTEVNRELDLHCIRAIRKADPRAAVGSLPVADSLSSQLISFYDIERPSWLREGISFRDSFAELIASMFGNDVVLVDSLLPELRRAGEPLFQRIHACRNEIQTALSARASELQAAGYREQVVPGDGDEYTLLFEIDENGIRRPFVGSATPPERISTSALTRPLLQDFVIQPDIFVGGPAEVAYYAQIAPLHDLLSVAMPRVALRGHALIAPSRVIRTMERYSIDVPDIFDSPDAILAAREAEGVSTVRRIAEEAKGDLIRRIGEIGELALPADHSLARSFQRSVGHIEYHFDALARRAANGLVRKDRERFAATRRAVAMLYPDRHVQDRVVGWYP
ncbi:MAG TPA: bacillithiol biosynthesis BshC, partial [Thermoanaerobaculia bacterium]